MAEMDPLGVRTHTIRVKMAVLYCDTCIATAMNLSSCFCGTCLQVKLKRQGNIQDYNKAHAKLMSRLKRHEVGDGPLSTHSVLSPGTELIRSYRGQTYTVTVLDIGFEWNGAHYGSLSELATRITGTRKSGPRFFGLKS